MTWTRQQRSKGIEAVQERPHVSMMERLREEAEFGWKAAEYWYQQWSLLAGQQPTKEGHRGK